MNLAIIYFLYYSIYNIMSSEYFSPCSFGDELSLDPIQSKRENKESKKLKKPNNFETHFCEVSTYYTESKLL